MPAKLKYVEGDVTQPIGSGERVIVHCCNNIGAWGAGVVMAISKRFGNDKGSPEGKYLEWASKKSIVPRPGQDAVPFDLGYVQFIPVGHVRDQLWVANMIGQVGTGMRPDGSAPVDYPAIAVGLQRVADFCKLLVGEVHCPKFGAGLAGGDWNRIEKLIDLYLVQQGINVTVYNYPEPKHARKPR